MNIDDSKILSIVIVRCPLGWLAHLRFADTQFDEDISASSKFVLNTRIDQKVFRALGLSHQTSDAAEFERKRRLPSTHYQRRMTAFR